jgi:hypothetical protein
MKLGCAETSDEIVDEPVNAATTNRNPIPM